MLWNKIKSYNSTVKMAVKESPKVMGDALRNQRISSKKAKAERVYVLTKKVFKAEQVLITTFQRVSLKILYSFLS
jgi:hypothetical protein